MRTEAEARGPVCRPKTAGLWEPPGARREAGDRCALGAQAEQPCPQRGRGLRDRERYVSMTAAAGDEPAGGDRCSRDGTAEESRGGTATSLAQAGSCVAEEEARRLGGQGRLGRWGAGGWVTAGSRTLHPPPLGPVAPKPGCARESTLRNTEVGPPESLIRLVCVGLHGGICERSRGDSD